MCEGAARSPIEATVEHVNAGAHVRDGDGNVVANAEGHGSRFVAGEDQ